MSNLQGDDLGNELAKLDRDDLEKMVRGLLTNGVALSFHGKRTAMEIARRVGHVSQGASRSCTWGRQSINRAIY